MNDKAVLGNPLASSCQTKRALAVFGFWIALTMCEPFFGSPASAATLLSIDELLDFPASQRGAIGPAELSMLCARGLPGAQEIDTAGCLTMLEQWRVLVRTETEKRLAELTRRDSSNLCKGQALLQVLHDALGSERKPTLLKSGTLEAAVAADLPLDPRDLFLCGVLENANLSHRPTSVSLPWLYLAVGRRLGYPLRLAAQDGRLLLRWEAPDEQFTLDWRQSWAEQTLSAPEMRFRVEQPGLKPLAMPADQSQPPPPPSPMHLLSADDELAMLLNARGACLESHGQNAEALIAYAQAHRLSPDCDNYLVAITHVMPKISPLFGHTEPVMAPDYTASGDPLEEINAFNRYNLQRQQDGEARMQENQRILKNRQDQRTNHP